MSAVRRADSVPASIRARLLNRSRQQKLEFQQVLSEFAIERLLYRLGASRHMERFVLKGAMLFKLWSDDTRRATWDLDLLGRGANSIEDVLAVIRDLCSIPVEDGILYDVGSITGEEIRAMGPYPGVRVRLEARLADARIPMQVDVGSGDAVSPPPTRATYPTLLGHPPPHVLAYPREAVVAEKLEAMVTLGVTNSRMKDFYDVRVLASALPFKGPVLAEAIQATFARRGTPLPAAEPLVLTRAFLAAPERQVQWRAFLRRSRLEGPVDAGDLAEALTRFLGPVLTALEAGRSFPAAWPAGGPWTTS